MKPVIIKSRENNKKDAQIHTTDIKGQQHLKLVNAFEKDSSLSTDG